MVPSFRERAKHWFAGAFFVLLVVGGIAPPSARANCDHDVTSNLSRSTRDSLYELDVLKDSSDLARGGIPRQDLPCSGPGCSKSQKMPRTPATSVPVRISDPFCCTTAAAHENDPGSDSKPVELSISRPRHLASPLERPPRIPRSRTIS
jgi:hypothetical protein